MNTDTTTLLSRTLSFLAALAAGVAVAACGGGSGKAAASGCNGLSSCCDSIAGAGAASCHAVVDRSGITESECSQELDSLNAAGLCTSGGGGSPGSGGSDAGGGSSGDSPGDGSVASPECAALTACCPSLPVFEDPMACLTVAGEGTPTACEESLASYQSSGYCQPPVVDAGHDPGVEGCYEMMTMGSSTTCEFISATTPGFSCPSPSKPGSCPTSGLVGCCLLMPSSVVTAASCYYDEATATVVMMVCSSDGGHWSTSAP